MIIHNPKELVRKEVIDKEGFSIGIIDKTWNSWNKDYPGYFFGIKPYQNARDTWFRGTTKLIPIYSDYISEYGQNVSLNKSCEELSYFWNKTVHLGINLSWPMDELIEMPVYDKHYCRIGTFFSWTEVDGTYRNYGVFLDPYLCEIWKFPYNVLLPLPPDYMTEVKDTICLNKTLDEMKSYWHQNYCF